MEKEKNIGSMVAAGLLALAAAVGAPQRAEAADGAALLAANCLSCHSAQGGSISRVEGQRKSPEGWQMTITRMQEQHGARIPPEDKRRLIKYLADTRGLAPAETAGWRYLLEHDNNRVETIDERYRDLCARCHSGARFALQRRSEDEWRLLMHAHIGLNPTLEFHSLARDRQWFQLAVNEVAPALAKDFALDARAWKAWQAAPRVALGGSWRITGYLPGKGAFEGRMRATAAGEDRFELAIEGRYADGAPLSGRGVATVYTGYEWRGSVDIDGIALRQVMAADARGERMQGRQHFADSRRMGGALSALREGAAPMVMAVMPAQLRRGETAELTVVGSGLSGAVSLGKGVRVLEVASRSADRVVVRARAEGRDGLNDVVVGSARGKSLLAVYDRVARVEVEPANAIARVGGPGDAQMEKVGVAYRAVGWAAGRDGKPGTADDLRLGYLPAQWSIEPADAEADKARDQDFVGRIGADGVFVPGDAGPNPARPKSLGNTGRVNVVAVVDEAGGRVEGRGKLDVAVPDFVHRALD